MVDMVREKRGALLILGVLSILVGSGAWAWQQLDRLPSGGGVVTPTAETQGIRRAQPGPPRTSAKGNPLSTGDPRSAVDLQRSSPESFGGSALAGGRIVRSTDREPIEGARVELRDLRAGAVFASAASREDGGFDFSGRDDLWDAERGPSFVLDVESPGHRPASWLLDPSSLPLGELALEPVASLEVRLWVEGSSPVARVPGERSFVRLKGVGSRGIDPGIESLEDPGTPHRFVDVPPGVYDLEAWAPGGGARRRYGISVRAGEAIELDFQLVRGSRVFGQVRRNEGGAPIPGVEVRAIPQPTFLDSTEAPRPTVRLGRTDDGGTYSLDGLGTGVHRMEFFLPGGSVVIRRLVLEEAASSERLDVTLLNRRTIRGHAVDSEGIPIEAARLTVLAGRALDGLDSRSTLEGFLDHPEARTVESDAEGRFELELEPVDMRRPGDIAIVGTPPADRPDLGSSAPAFPGSARGTVDLVARVVLGARCPFEIRCIDAAGRGIEGVEVTLSTGGRPPHLVADVVRSGADGLVGFEGIEGRPMQLTAEAPGFRTVVAKVIPMPDGAIGPTRIPMVPASGLEVFVRDPAGRAIEGARLLHRVEAVAGVSGGSPRLDRLVASQAVKWKSVGTTDSSGRAEVVGLGPGRHRFRASHPLHGSEGAATRAVDVPSASFVTLELTPIPLEATASARLRLTLDGPGEFPSQLRFKGLGEVHVDRVGAQVLLSGIAAGEVEPSLEAEGFVGAELGSFRLEPGMETDFGTVVLRRGSGVTVIVTDADSQPVRGAHVRVVPADGGSGGAARVGGASWSLGEKRPGRYVFDGVLEPGEYRALVGGRRRVTAEREFTLEPGEDSVIRIRSRPVNR